MPSTRLPSPSALFQKFVSQVERLVSSCRRRPASVGGEVVAMKMDTGVRRYDAKDDITVENFEMLTSIQRD